MLVFLISIFIFIISLVAIAIFHIHHIRTLKENEFKYNSHINALTNEIENEKKSTRTKQQDVSDSVTSMNTETQQHTNDANKHFIGTEKENTFESIKDNQEKLFAQGQLLQEQSSSIQRNKDKIHDLSQHSKAIKASLSALDDITTENQLQKKVNENSKIRREIDQGLNTLQRQLTNFKKGVLDNQPEYEDKINEVMKNINLVENELINQHVLNSSIHFKLSDLPSDNKELTKERNAFNKIQNSNQFLTRELSLAQSNLNVLKTSKSNVLEEIEDINSSIQTYSDNNTLVGLSNQIYGWTTSNNALQQELDVMNVAINTHQQLKGSNIDAKTSLSNQLVECHASLSDYQLQWASVQERLENEIEILPVIKQPVESEPVVDETLERKSSFAYSFAKTGESSINGWTGYPMTTFKYPTVYISNNTEFDAGEITHNPFYSILYPSNDKVYTSIEVNHHNHIINAFCDWDDSQHRENTASGGSDGIYTTYTTQTIVVYEFNNGPTAIDTITIVGNTQLPMRPPDFVTIKYYDNASGSYVLVENQSPNASTSFSSQATTNAYDEYLDYTFTSVTSNKFKIIMNNSSTNYISIRHISLKGQSTNNDTTNNDINTAPVSAHYLTLDGVDGYLDVAYKNSFEAGNLTRSTFTAWVNNKNEANVHSIEPLMFKANAYEFGVDYDGSTDKTKGVPIFKMFDSTTNQFVETGSLVPIEAPVKEPQADRDVDYVKDTNEIQVANLQTAAEGDSVFIYTDSGTQPKPIDLGDNAITHYVDGTEFTGLNDTNTSQYSVSTWFKIKS